jgi:hypothetical protein
MQYYKRGAVHIMAVLYVMHFTHYEVWLLNNGTKHNIPGKIAGVGSK